MINVSVRALRESVVPSSSLFDRTPVMMHTLDQERRFLAVSDYWLDNLGYERDEVIGKCVFDFLTESSTKRARNILSRDYKALGSVVAVPLECKKKDGSILSVLLSTVNEYDDKGNVVCRHGILTDLTEKHRLENELVEISEREQRRLGRDLHDDVGQTLLGAWLICEHMKVQALDLDPEVWDTAERVSKALQRCLEKLRSLVNGLNVVGRTPAEFKGAIDELAADMEKTYQSRGLVCTVRLDEEIVLPDADTTTHLVRITQEAMTNAVWHGEATKIIIQLTRKKGNVELSIRDNGKGIESSEQYQNQYGIRIMNYRSRIIKGDLDIRRLESGGTIVSCVFPITNKP